MASSLISGAVALLLILTGGYVIAGGILTIAETTMVTQSDMTVTQEKIRQTDLAIISGNWSSSTVTLKILNTGTISFDKDNSGFDLFLCNDQNVTERVEIFSRSIDDDITNKGFWDPSETLVISKDPGYTPTWAKISTPNGVSSSINL